MQSTESQAERMETAVTEFQRRFHISADDEHASSPASSQNHQVWNRYSYCCRRALIYGSRLLYIANKITVLIPSRL